MQNPPIGTFKDPQLDWGQQFLSNTGIGGFVSGLGSLASGLNPILQGASFLTGILGLNKARKGLYKDPSYFLGPEYAQLNKMAGEYADPLSRTRNIAFRRFNRMAANAGPSAAAMSQITAQSGGSPMQAFRASEAAAGRASEQALGAYEGFETQAPMIAGQLYGTAGNMYQNAANMSQQSRYAQAGADADFASTLGGGFLNLIS